MSNIWNIELTEEERDEVAENRLSEMMDDFLNDDRDEFDLEVHRAAGVFDGVVRPGDRGGELREHEGRIGQFETGFLDVIGVVHADGEDLARPGNRSVQLRFDHRSSIGEVHCPGPRDELVPALEDLLGICGEAPGAGGFDVDAASVRDEGEPAGLICHTHENESFERRSSVGIGRDRRVSW